MTKQAKPKQSSRRQRNANVISPVDRITAIYGLEYIKKRFEDALVKAKDVKTTLALGDYRQITDDNLKLVGKPIVSVSFTCKVKSDDKKMYPTIKFRLAHHIDKPKEIFGEQQDQYDQSSVPLDLHRLAACCEADWDTSLLKKHTIHRCHRKECFKPSHLYFGTVDQNRSTDFCPAYANINGTLVSICAHELKCLVHERDPPTTIESVNCRLINNVLFMRPWLPINPIKQILTIPASFPTVPLARPHGAKAVLFT